MTIPKFDELFNDILEFLSDKNEYRTRDVKESISKKLDLTDEERQKLLPSGSQPVIINRIGWSITSLKKAGYVESKKWGFINITELGLKEHEKNPNITLDDLIKVQTFNDWFNPDSKSKDDSDDNFIESNTGDLTPEETIEIAYKTMNNQLSELLLESILNNDSYFFEKLVFDLLLKMGYGELGKMQVLQHLLLMMVELMVSMKIFWDWIKSVFKQKDILQIMLLENLYFKVLQEHYLAVV